MATAFVLMFVARPAAVILGLQRLNLRRFERFGHALAGSTILACGLAETVAECKVLVAAAGSESPAQGW